MQYRKFGNTGVEISTLGFGCMRLKEIEQPDGQAWCMDCSKTVPLSNFGEPCPLCGGFHLTPTGGKEMRVIDLIAD